ncbi:MAG: hypothetical protein KF841_11600 [Phycisphaerae bacterium]|nr:hypothetical protein [Phycisphaerae bacterium]
MKQTVLSWSMVLLVGLACPSACALGAQGEKKSEPAKACCCQHDSSPEMPVPASDSTDCSCFCSGHGVQATKPDSFPSGERADAIGLPSSAPMRIAAGCHICATRLSRAIHPPGANRSLPLLI